MCISHFYTFSLFNIVLQNKKHFSFVVRNRAFILSWRHYRSHIAAASHVPISYVRKMISEIACAYGERKGECSKVQWEQWPGRVASENNSGRASYNGMPVDEETADGFRDPNYSRTIIARFRKACLVWENERKFIWISHWRAEKT